MFPLEKMLHEKFKYTDFKSGQKEIITSVLEQEQTLGILPTGSGKSLCYQLASYYLSGVTLIVSPLVSLMEDQVQQMKASGEKAVVAFNSQLNFQEKEWVLAHLAWYKFIFISPEMLLQENMRQQFKRLPISLLVVDEAHCISQWGIDFRPEYEQLAPIVKEFQIPKVLALTATATEKVTSDIREKLFPQGQPMVIRRSVDRPNIAYQVVETTDKLAFLVDYFQQRAGFGIIYFSSKKQSEAIAKQLGEATELRVAFYHGDLTSQERSLIQQQAIQGQLDILCATSAFGMGINKKDVRHVLHYHLPGSLEAYLQESGRAGRDGAPSWATLLYERGDEHIHFFLQNELSEAQGMLAHLKLKSPAELQEDLGELDKLTKKWVQGYLANQYTFAELSQNLAMKQQEKVSQLQDILAYLKTNGCRREFLLAYFGEKQQSPNAKCCDNCGNYDNILVNPLEKVAGKLKKPKNWQENLKNLFISDN